MIDRKYILKHIEQAFETHQAVALLGPRQCGKTTIALQYNALQEKNIKAIRFDLENPEDLGLFENPLLILKGTFDLAIIDEVQRVPELFPILRHVIDSDPTKKFLILGSASRELIRQSSESLAGRIAFIEITPFGLKEIKEPNKLWIRGGFPKSYLAPSEEGSRSWRKNYITTFLEQDIPNLGFSIPAYTLRRFWAMLAHYHGNVVNLSEIGRSLGVSHTTVSHYLDILEGTFMIRLLRPWFANINKRQVKSPKLYFRDSGLLHSLLQADTQEALMRHPKLGASWEGYALEETVRILEAESNSCYFWGVHSQGELDLIIEKNGAKIGFEIKYAQAPKITSSIKSAQSSLNLDHIFIIHPGEKSLPLGERVSSLSINHLGSFDDQLWTIAANKTKQEGFSGETDSETFLQEILKK